MFSLTSEEPGREALLGFVIDMATHNVSTVAPISVRLTPNAWIAENIAPVSDDRAFGRIRI